jgi:hypothetical protein
VVDGSVEAQFVLHKGAFLGAAGNPNRLGAGELCQLADQRAHWSARRCDNHGLTGLRLADRPQTAIRGEARHAEDAERRRHRCRRQIELAQRRAVEANAVRQRMRAPAGHSDDKVALRITRMVRGEHSRHRFAGHDIAESDRHRVGFPVVPANTVSNRAIAVLSL